MRHSCWGSQILVFGNALRESQEIKCGDVTKERIKPVIEKEAAAHHTYCFILN